MHFHPCCDCQQDTECPGEWEPNPDGFPETVCSVIHIMGQELVCEACSVQRETNDEAEGIDR